MLRENHLMREAVEVREAAFVSKQQAIASMVSLAEEQANAGNAFEPVYAGLQTALESHVECV